MPRRRPTQPQALYIHWVPTFGVFEERLGWFGENIFVATLAR